MLPFAARRIPHDLWIESFTPPFSTSFVPLFSPGPVVGFAQNLSGREMSRRYKLPFFLIERLGLRCYHDVVVLNPADGQTVSRCNPAATVRVIPNSVNLPWLDERQFGTGEHILFLGRVQVWEKGLDLLLAAYADGRPELPLVIAGAGTPREEQRLIALLRTAGPGVHWVGHVSGERKDALLRRSAMLVLPSRSEAFGIAALEGMAYGKPVVHFGLPTLDWMRGDVCVPPFDTGALAVALRGLATDQGRRAGLGRAARNAARQFGRDAMADRYLTLVRQLLGSPGSAGPGEHSTPLGASPQTPRPGTPRGRPPGAGGHTMNANPLAAILARGGPLVVLSPHLDDAALSCGAMMIHACQTIPVTVATLFTEAGPPPYTLSARRYLHQVGAKDAPALYRQRREEDRAALQPLGITCVHAGLVDAPFRRQPGPRARSWRARLLPEFEHIYPIYRLNITSGRIAPADAGTLRAAASLIQRLATAGPALVLAPLGVGQHVDHVLVRTAAERSGADIAYYSDFPHNQHHPADRAFIKRNGLVEARWPLSLEAKVELVRAYRTQTGALFPGGRIPLVPEVFYFRPQAPSGAPLGGASG